MTLLTRRECDGQVEMSEHPSWEGDSSLEVAGVQLDGRVASEQIYDLQRKQFYRRRNGTMGDRKRTRKFRRNGMHLARFLWP